MSPPCTNLHATRLSSLPEANARIGADLACYWAACPWGNLHFSMGKADAVPFWHCRLLAACACVYLKLGIPPPKYPKMASLKGIIIADWGMDLHAFTKGCHMFRQTYMFVFGITHGSGECCNRAGGATHHVWRSRGKHLGEGRINVFVIFLAIIGSGWLNMCCFQQ